MGNKNNLSRLRLLPLLAGVLLYSCAEMEKAPVAPQVGESQTETPAASLSSAQAVSDLWVFDESLQAPWINASWSATVTFNSTEQAYASTYSIKTALTSAWGALSLHYGNWGTEGISPASFSSVDFVVHGGPSGANLSIFFENDAGQSFPKVNYGSVPAGQWTVISIPMNQLNPNGQIINRVDIQDLSGSVRTFYVDNFRFTATTSTSTPPAPSLASPANGASGVSESPTLTWNASSGASTYRVQVSTGSAFTFTVVDQGNITSTSYSISQLSQNTTYYWRVNASNSIGTSDWSTVWNFTTGAPPSPPTLVSPSDGATGVASNPMLTWNSSSGAASYSLQISTSSTFGSVVVNQSNITGTSYQAGGLSNSTTYYWRVNASNTAGTSEWSNVWSFTTASPPAQAPDLTVDADRIRATMQIRWKTFSSSSCAVIEGCASPGSRKLLRFEVTVPNFGNADLFLGNPEENPQLFHWSSCHGHYHFEDFAEYRLLNASNQRVVIGRKQAFCLLDSKRYWSGYSSQGYNCDYQGISVGWADVYGRSLDCQWLDITGIPSGDYIIEVEVNVGGFINEGANTWPNVVRVPVRL